MAQQSLANGQLTFIAKYYWPHIIADEIVFNWEEKTITFEQIAFVDGKIIYRDCIDEYNNLYSTLLDEAKQQVLRKIQDKKSKFKNWQEFIKLVKEVWPNLSLFEDLEWLKLIFNQEFDKRTVILKKQIVDTFCKNLDKPSYKRWSDIADKTSDLPFGIIKEANLKVVQNLMWILGFKPLKQLPPARACHNFHDYESFFPYFDLYVETRNLSPLRNEIANDQSIIKRQSKIPHDIEQKHDLDRFIDWFVSKPYLNVDDYNAR